MQPARFFLGHSSCFLLIWHGHCAFVPPFDSVSQVPFYLVDLLLPRLIRFLLPSICVCFWPPPPLLLMRAKLHPVDSWRFLWKSPEYVMHAVFQPLISVRIRRSRRLWRVQFAIAEEHLNRGTQSQLRPYLGVCKWTSWPGFVCSTEFAGFRLPAASRLLCWLNVLAVWLAIK